MCGFAGYFNLTNKQFSINQSLLERMQHELKHRGPDGQGTWTSDEHELALVHRRLSIIDLSDHALQPMIDAENKVIICVNGEIYNYKELQKELEWHGHQFSSQCDAEVILHGYKQWGIDQLLERLDGMFAFCLYDFVKRELFLVRDRIGIKPLYFSLQHDILSFASEIKALWHLPWLQKKISKAGIYHYLTYLATPAPTTIYESIYKLPPGFYLKVDAQKKLQAKQWYSLSAHLSIEAQKADEQYCVQQIRAFLRSAIKKRMMSDVPFGVFLSGGIDSSLNVALMSEYTPQVKTFSVAFSDGPEYDELQWARKVAHYYGTDHHEIVIDESDAFTFFKQMVYHQDEPIGDCVCIPVYYVSKLAKDAGVTVVQVGEGSDELFCGYPSYANVLDMYRWWHYSQVYMPTIAKKGMFYAAQKCFPDKFTKLDMLRNWANNKELFYSGTVVFSEYLKQIYLVCTDMQQAAADQKIVDLFFNNMALTDSYCMADWYRQQLKSTVPKADQLTQMGYLELKHRLPELLLMRVDKMSMAASVEARVPFLDHKLVEFALTIPKDLKYHGSVTKYILKKAAEGILPHDIIYRKKMGFAAPIYRWFKKGTQFNEMLSDLLANNDHALHEMVDVSKIKQMQKRNKTDESIDYSYHLWAVQNILALF